jgi:hypothetical protein
MSVAMKHFRLLTPVAPAALLSGCATGTNRPVTDMVGPAGSRPPLAGSTHGALVVYSAYDTGAGYLNRDSSEPVHSDYEILTRDGKPLRRVHNNSGSILQDPMTVNLPPGKYEVMAAANGYLEQVTIPVEIDAGRVTILHLEGGGFWPNAAAFNKTNEACLPDGMVVGWKAAPGPQTSND